MGAREHEVRIMGFALAALALLATFLVIWVASGLGSALHAQVERASVTVGPDAAARP
jgi:hypothetical protein